MKVRILSATSYFNISCFCDPKTEMWVVMLDVSLFVRIIKHAVDIKLDIKMYFWMWEYEFGILTKCVFPGSVWQDCWPIKSRSVCILKPEVYCIYFNFYCMFHPHCLKKPKLKKYTSCFLCFEVSWNFLSLLSLFFCYLNLLCVWKW